jgi:hypothetical protein
MNSIIYKLVLCAVIALCLFETVDYLFNNVIPSANVAVSSMILTSCLLFERLYIILYLEQHIMGQHGTRVDKDQR